MRSPAPEVGLWVERAGDRPIGRDRPHGDREQEDSGVARAGSPSFGSDGRAILPTDGRGPASCSCTSSNFASQASWRNGCWGVPRGVVAPLLCTAMVRPNIRPNIRTEDEPVHDPARQPRSKLPIAPEIRPKRHRSDDHHHRGNGQCLLQEPSLRTAKRHDAALLLRRVNIALTAAVPPGVAATGGRRPLVVVLRTRRKGERIYVSIDQYCEALIIKGGTIATNNRADRRLIAMPAERAGYVAGINRQLVGMIRAVIEKLDAFLFA
jgi:hypothetical protein